MFKIYDEGACSRYVFKRYDEPASPNQGGGFDIYDEPVSPNHLSYLRFMLKNNSSSNSNNTIYLECPSGTRLRVCAECKVTSALSRWKAFARAMLVHLARHASRRHRQCLSNNQLPVRALSCFVSPQPSLFKPRKCASRSHPASKNRKHMDPSGAPDIDIAVANGGAAPCAQVAAGETLGAGVAVWQRCRIGIDK